MTAPVERVDMVPPAEGTAKEHRATLKAATAIAEAVTTARDFVNTPPNDLFPASFADRAAALAKAAGVDVEILDEKALRKGGFGGVLGVGMGSTRPPRVVRMSYRGPKARKKVALVGKGITFDTGGISIKPAADMEEMTSDMSGAAAIVATVVLAAKLKYPLEVIATVPMAENMPSGAAYRPGDVLTMYGGKTVEVLNTDAEGRLILADAIVRACEDGPDYLVESGHADRRADRGARPPHPRHHGLRRVPRPGRRDRAGHRRGRLADAAAGGAARRPGLEAGGPRPTSPATAGAACSPRASSCASSSPTACRGRTSTSPGPAFNTRRPWGYTAKGGTGVPVRTLAAVLADIAENG